jgi:hypothetical protein
MIRVRSTVLAKMAAVCFKYQGLLCSYSNDILPGRI